MKNIKKEQNKKHRKAHKNSLQLGNYKQNFYSYFKQLGSIIMALSFEWHDQHLRKRR